MCRICPALGFGTLQSSLESVELLSLAGIVVLIDDTLWLFDLFGKSEFRCWSLPILFWRGEQKTADTEGGYEKAKREDAFGTVGYVKGK